MAFPTEIQTEIVRSIRGLEHAIIIRPGYAIEYDYVKPTHLQNTLQSRILQNLYFAGQVNGTTGYEEAAGQGIIAGINAALAAQGRRPFVLGRS